MRAKWGKPAIAGQLPTKGLPTRMRAKVKGATLAAYRVYKLKWGPNGASLQLQVSYLHLLALICLATLLELLSHWSTNGQTVPNYIQELATILHWSSLESPSHPSLRTGPGPVSEASERASCLASLVLCGAQSKFTWPHRREFKFVLSLCQVIWHGIESNIKVHTWYSNYIYITTYTQLHIRNYMYVSTYT